MGRRNPTLPNRSPVARLSVGGRADKGTDRPSAPAWPQMALRAYPVAGWPPLKVVDVPVAHPAKPLCGLAACGDP